MPILSPLVWVSIFIISFCPLFHESLFPFLGHLLHYLNYSTTLFQAVVLASKRNESAERVIILPFGR